MAKIYAVYLVYLIKSQQDNNIYIFIPYGNDCWDFPDPRCRYAPQMQNPLSYD